ncbi:MAG: hypothetical protein JW791_00875 [Nanoarchaeota archaeon]|nr:hypothetical protein [Nanoarchaeota archaeon]
MSAESEPEVKPVEVSNDVNLVLKARSYFLELQNKIKEFLASDKKDLIKKILKGEKINIDKKLKDELVDNEGVPYITRINSILQNIEEINYKPDETLSFTEQLKKIQKALQPLIEDIKKKAEDKKTEEPLVIEAQIKRLQKLIKNPFEFYTLANYDFIRSRGKNFFDNTGKEAETFLINLPVGLISKDENRKFSNLIVTKANYKRIRDEYVPFLIKKYKNLISKFNNFISNQQYLSGKTKEEIKKVQSSIPSLRFTLREVLLSSEILWLLTEEEKEEYSEKEPKPTTHEEKNLVLDFLKEKKDDAFKAFSEGIGYSDKNEFDKLFDKVLIIIDKEITSDKGKERFEKLLKDNKITALQAELFKNFIELKGDIKVKIEQYSQAEFENEWNNNLSVVWENTWKAAGMAIQKHPDKKVNLFDWVEEEEKPYAENIKEIIDKFEKIPQPKDLTISDKAKTDVKIIFKEYFRNVKEAKKSFLKNIDKSFAKKFETFYDFYTLMIENYINDKEEINKVKELMSKDYHPDLFIILYDIFLIEFDNYRKTCLNSLKKINDLNNAQPVEDADKTFIELFKEELKQDYIKNNIDYWKSYWDYLGQYMVYLNNLKSFKASNAEKTNQSAGSAAQAIFDILGGKAEGFTKEELEEIKRFQAFPSTAELPELEPFTVTPENKLPDLSPLPELEKIVPKATELFKILATKDIEAERDKTTKDFTTEVEKGNIELDEFASIGSPGSHEQIVKEQTKNIKIYFNKELKNIGPIREKLKRLDSKEELLKFAELLKKKVDKIIEYCNNNYPEAIKTIIFIDEQGDTGFLKDRFGEKGFLRTQGLLEKTIEQLKEKSTGESELLSIKNNLHNHLSNIKEYLTIKELRIK